MRSVCYGVAAVERPDDGTVTGIDMNTGQVATSDGEILHAPVTDRLEARCKRLQRRMSRGQQAA